MRARTKREGYYTREAGSAYDKSEGDGTEHASDEAFNSLLWRKLDEHCSAVEDSEQVGEDIVGYDEKAG